MMTIHTFELYSMITNEQYYKIQNVIKKSNDWKWNKNILQYWGLSDSGIFITLNRIKKYNYSGYLINYRISAQRVLEYNNYVGLFQCGDISKLIKKTNKILKKVCNDFPSIESCNIDRCDFCINIKLENQQQVKSYIKILRRSNLPAGFQFRIYYDTKSKRTKPYKDDVTIFSKNNLEISIYNKYKQMKKEMEGNKKYIFPDIDKAENILRMEIRCMEGKLKQIKSKYNIKNITDLMDHADEVGTYLFEYYLPKMFGTGAFYTLKEAKRRITMSGFKEENMKIMTDLVEVVSESRSFSSCYYSFCKGYGKGKMKKIMELFNDINTSPITVPREDKKIFVEEEIQNPLDLFNDHYNKL